ncbi:hypothetical protein A3F55_01605 [Candidatus Adlerbacteria bacterium RIFCSPHIGHO2_12_FULL_53_18]|uniref:NodB homology domain-containing protein n=2 Tax=Parcubacteria group TaxID=1794811 RepID=A0A1F4XS43_9BACT|nr:MAG: hypothetical protein A3F55_01605 [Candidatus Adlerbacteria bacterium RIFCSPHIGHO2_12_FULL_53_18]OGG51483.1 MAG: hypothetical protein A2704_04165 [Candidatus Kaiserbacteria bacterium RIFCSPHIGHO2_01_FULL_54_36b]
MRILRLITACFAHTCFAAVFATVALAAQPQVPTPAPRPTPTGKVSITFDDGLLSQYEYGRAIVRKYGLPGTLFINTDGIADTPTGVGERGATMSWEQVRSWTDMHWEVGSHSHSHPMLTSVDEHQLREELGYPAAVMYRNLGFYPTSFASPSGDYNDAVLETVKNLYDNQVGAWGESDAGEGQNPLTGIDHYQVNRLIVTRDTAVKDVCAAVGRAAKERSWLVLGFHDIVPEPGQSDENKYEVSTDNFEQIARCTLGKVLEGAVEAVTVKDALRAIPSLSAQN